MLLGAAEALSRTRTGLASGEYHSLESTTQALLNTWWQFTSRCKTVNRSETTVTQIATTVRFMDHDAGLDPTTALRND